MPKTRSGFTIVELLIVIVVIAILAAISVVAYNGIQNRAQVARAISDLKSINNTIQLYYAEKGHYPTTGTLGTTVYRQSNANPTDYVPNVIPSYVGSLPKPAYSGTAHNDSYTYITNGNEYKIIAHGSSGTANSYSILCTTVRTQDSSLLDPARSSASACNGFGFWSPGGASF